MIYLYESGPWGRSFHLKPTCVQWRKASDSVVCDAWLLVSIYVSQNFLTLILVKSELKRLHKSLRRPLHPPGLSIPWLWWIECSLPACSGKKIPIPGVNQGQEALRLVWVFREMWLVFLGNLPSQCRHTNPSRTWLKWTVEIHLQQLAIWGSVYKKSQGKASLLTRVNFRCLPPHLNSSKHFKIELIFDNLLT